MLRETNTCLYTQIETVSVAPVGRLATVSSRAGEMRSRILIGRARAMKYINKTTFHLLGISLHPAFRATVPPVLYNKKLQKIQI